MTIFPFCCSLSHFYGHFYITPASKYYMLSLYEQVKESNVMWQVEEKTQHIQSITEMTLAIFLIKGHRHSQLYKITELKT